ncbi:hypothetical protein MASR2M79_24430 [Aminivibrio sp.]
MDLRRRGAVSAGCPRPEELRTSTGMAAPDGDVIIKDRPSGYGPGEPSIHRMKNAFPAKPLPSALQALPEQKDVDAPSAKLLEQESMAEETVLQKSILDRRRGQSRP